MSMQYCAVLGAKQVAVAAVAVAAAVKPAVQLNTTRKQTMRLKQRTQVVKVQQKSNCQGHCAACWCCSTAGGCACKSLAKTAAHALSYSCHVGSLDRSCLVHMLSPVKSLKGPPLPCFCGTIWPAGSCAHSLKKRTHCGRIARHLSCLYQQARRFNKQHPLLRATAWRMRSVCIWPWNPAGTCMPLEM